MSNDVFQPLTSSSDWEDALAASESAPVVVFKHSSACPTSARANGEMEGLAGEMDTPIYRVVVQDARSVSDAIADDLDVRHETPQVIVLSDGASTYDASHYRVKADDVRSALNGTAE
jgi:bacillithiol system protein YtxJ